MRAVHSKSGVLAGRAEVDDPVNVGHQGLLTGEPRAQVRDILLDPLPRRGVGPRQLPFGLRPHHRTKGARKGQL